jgi:2-polyprenyl-6-methoxyphenol hydroxylase-like FAD-dependent oxidoreductase
MRELEYKSEEDLGISHPLAVAGAKRLEGLSAIVIGAGPAGLTFARQAAEQGADVTLLEKASDPFGPEPGYTNRSFNITLEEAGRAVLGTERAWQGGQWLKGRAVHIEGSKQVCYGSYGNDQEHHLVSIPRPVLRKNMTALAQEAGVRRVFNANVTYVHPDAGIVEYELGGIVHKLSADLVVVSDGLHSLGDEVVQRIAPGVLRQDQHEFVSARLRPEDSPGLSMEHIHFWHGGESDAYTIGIPNADGSLGLLLLSAYADLAPREHPFATPQAAEARLRRDFPELYYLSPELARQLPMRHRGRFLYKLAESFIVGARAVLVGDAGCAFPPWAGLGANGAMYAAASLVYQLIDHPGDMAAAMHEYNAHQRALGEIIMDQVAVTGEYLNKGVAKNPGRGQNLLRPLVKEARERMAPVEAVGAR